MSVKIYQHYLPNPWRFRYSSKPSVSPWKPQGTAFQAFTTKADGLVPVYEYRANNPIRYQYSTESSIGHGWTRGNVAFYASTGLIAGFVPVYAFLPKSRDIYRYLYSTEASVADTGWSRASSGPSFYALPKDLAMTYRVRRMDYQNLTPTDARMDLLTSQVFKNPSAVTLSESIHRTFERTATFTLGFSETLTVGAKATFEGGVPLIGQAEVEASSELSLESHQAWTQSEKQSFSVSRTITVQPRTSVKATSFLKWAEDFKTPFVMHLAIKASSASGSLTGAQIEQLLKLGGFTGTVEQVKAQEIDVTLRGELEGGFGLNTFTEIEELEGPVV